MKLWIRKIFVAFIAIMTLGLYIPPIMLDTDASSKEVDESKAEFDQETLSIQAEQTADEEQIPYYEEPVQTDNYYTTLTEQAKQLTVTKLGPRIINQVESDFTTEILPSLENVIKEIIDQFGEEAGKYLAITEQPTEGYGERIFNIYDYRLNNEIAKFHVRRDNRPAEGYWFNFHYHLIDDGYEEHHTIGEIYWDKNTPPKWMS